MWISVDFDSDEAIYIQLHNQIIEGIATDKIRVGESLPSVRSLAELIGINMHTVNKAYTILKQEGYITLDRRRGAVISLDLEQNAAILEMVKDMRKIVARAKCNNLSTEQIHEIVDGVIEEFM